MIKVWRLVTRRPVNVAFYWRGSLALRRPGEQERNSDVYSTESRALALLEMLVQDEPLRASYVLIPAAIPSGLTVETIDLNDLPANWREPKGSDALRR